MQPVLMGILPTLAQDRPRRSTNMVPNPRYLTLNA